MGCDIFNDLIGHVFNSVRNDGDERLNPDPVPLLLAACESALEHMHSTLHRESRDLLERAIAKAKGAPNADTR